MTWLQALSGFGAGLLLALLTAPVGVSGAVFLLPFQLDVLRVPSPAVTPTNLLFNIVSVPGALLRYHSQGQLRGPLVRQLLTATVPGVVLGALIRVYLVPDTGAFRLIVAAVLLPLGLWLCWPSRPAARTKQQPPPPSKAPVAGLALIVGVVGGIYGIGGGSILGPILVGLGLPVTAVAPAALASTFLTSAVGVAIYALLAMTTTDPIAPVWPLGLACGFGGLIGGYLGARLQPRLPARLLRMLLGVLAVVLALLYVAQTVR